MRKIVVLLLVLALALCPLACRVVDGESGGEIKIELLSPSDGEVVLLNHPEVQGLLESGEESEIAKITLKDSDGNAVNGEWTSEYGKTEWTFAHETLKGG